MDTCCRVDLTSSSTSATSLMTLLAASCASCLAAVVLTDADDPVSSSNRSRSNLHWWPRGSGEPSQNQNLEHSGCQNGRGTNLDVMT